MSTFSVDIDPGLCMGAQRCSFLVPGIFALDEEGIAEVVDPNGLTLEQAELAAAECPNLAISVVTQEEPSIAGSTTSDSSTNGRQ